MIDRAIHDALVNFAFDNFEDQSHWISKSSYGKLVRDKYYFRDNRNTIIYYKDGCDIRADKCHITGKITFS